MFLQSLWLWCDVCSAERLREAQSINKSLSALGDVISALSEGEKFIPYRNNKLTQLMQDSLGGNAKTLMFVNFSPADYNADETVTSLAYATRVKKITNNASKVRTVDNLSVAIDAVFVIDASTHSMMLIVYINYPSSNQFCQQQAESEEIARLKAIISKLQHGHSIPEEEVEDSAGAEEHK